MTYIGIYILCNVFFRINDTGNHASWGVKYLCIYQNEKRKYITYNQLFYLLKLCRSNGFGVKMGSLWIWESIEYILTVCNVIVINEKSYVHNCISAIGLIQWERRGRFSSVIIFLLQPFFLLFNFANFYGHFLDTTQ